MDSTLITSRQAAMTDTVGAGNTSIASDLIGTSAQFTNLLQQKLNSKTLIEGSSESSASVESSVDAKKFQDSEDSAKDKQVGEDKEKDKSDDLSDLAHVDPAIQEEKAVSVAPILSKADSKDTEQIDNASSTSDKNPSSNVIGVEDDASNKGIKKAINKDKDLLEIDSQLFTGNLQESNTNPVVNNLQGLNAGRNDIKSEVENNNSLELTGTDNVQQIVPEIQGKNDNVVNLALTDQIGSQTTNLVTENKITQERKPETIPKISNAVTGIEENETAVIDETTDTKENSTVVPLDKQKENASTTVDSKVIEDMTRSQVANLMMENSVTQEHKTDFTAKISDSATILQSKTATSIVKTLLSGASKQVTVQLEPGSLGKIEISLQSTSNEVSLNFKLSSNHAKLLISSISTQLEQVLNDQIAADKTTSNRISAYQTTASILDGAQFSFGQHQFGQQANQNSSKTRFAEQYRNNKIGQDEASNKKQDKKQQNEKNIISILA
ncbi:flagellar hook-length control protein FliK [Lactobacillus sp. UCMA15818]|uniref:flagellar hook-length control protein FliK n=1 Tax=Lactobacillus sp. UCMA15818 TaxID=2583394 RepID=UPI0025B15224|nr:flagellar hook-length control protein FliK [Lactobacillus sp. UCMA15818]MDN2453755.1 flagellar hook-length control protein FliK [Lactobacillus sp. UCMA15818]